jgi:hypothetical protein
MTVPALYGKALHIPYIPICLHPYTPHEPASHMTMSLRSHRWRSNAGCGRLQFHMSQRKRHSASGPQNLHACKLTKDRLVQDGCGQCGSQSVAAPKGTRSPHPAARRRPPLDKHFSWNELRVGLQARYNTF